MGILQNLWALRVVVKSVAANAGRSMLEVKSLGQNAFEVGVVIIPIGAPRMDCFESNLKYVDL